MTKIDLYVLYTKTYELKKSGIPHFNPQKDEISIFGNIFDWTVSLSNPEENKIYALDAESLRLLKQIDLRGFIRDIQQNNFPVRLTFTSLSVNTYSPYLNVTLQKCARKDELLPGATSYNLLQRSIIIIYQAKRLSNVNSIPPFNFTSYSFVSCSNLITGISG